MINFVSELVYEYQRQISDDRRLLHTMTRSGTDVKFGSVTLSFTTSSNQQTAVYAISTAAPENANSTIATTLDVVSVSSNPGSYPSDGGSTTTPIQIGGILGINSLSAQGSSPLRITSEYNAIFGTNLSNAEVWALLKSIYGDDIQQFGVLDYNGEFPLIGGNYRFGFRNDPATTDFGDGCYNNDWVSSSIPENYIPCFADAKAIDPDYVTAIGTDVVKLQTYLAFTRDVPEQKLIFNVYVDGVIGSTAPQMSVTFSNANSGDDNLIVDSLVTPRIWGFPVALEDSPSIVIGPPIITVDGIQVPNEEDANYARTQYSGSFEFSGRFESPYASLSDSMIGWRPAGDQVAFYGADRICDYIRLYMRFDYELPNSEENDPTTWGDLWYVDIPFNYEGAVYITPAMISNSANNKQFNTEVRVIGGLPPTDQDTDTDKLPPGQDKTGDSSTGGPYPPGGYVDMSDGEPSGFGGDAVLTTTYAMPKLTMQSVGADLWSQTYYNVLKIQNNPIENIIACKWFPMNLTGTANTPIKIGDVTLGVAADKISTMYTKTFGTYKHVPTDDRPGYLSMTPYCIVKLHLPYVGVVQLDASEIYNQDLTGKYVVDLITGDVLVILYLDGNPYMTLTGKMGVDIPLTSSNRVQTELAAASRTMSAAIGAAGALMSGNIEKAGGAASGIMSIMGMDYSSQRCTSHSPACSTFENLWIFLEIQYNPAPITAGYKAQRGQPAHIYTTLQELKSKGAKFVQIDARTTINVAMTDEENRMLEQIMTTGFYL